MTEPCEICGSNEGVHWYVSQNTNDWPHKTVYRGFYACDKCVEQRATVVVESVTP